MTKRGGKWLRLNMTRNTRKIGQKIGLLKIGALPREELMDGGYHCGSRTETIPQEPTNCFGVA